GLAVAGALALPLLVWSHGRAAAFESSRALWSASLAVAPDNAVARTNLALVELDPDPLGDAFDAPVDAAAVERAEAQLELALEVARYPQHRLRAAMLLSDLARSAQRFERAAHFMAQAAEVADGLGRSGLAGPELRVPLHLQAARLARICGDAERAKRHFAAAQAPPPQRTAGPRSAAALLRRAPRPRAPRGALLHRRAAAGRGGRRARPRRGGRSARGADRCAARRGRARRAGPVRAALDARRVGARARHAARRREGPA